jgi:hypothetical protein
MLKYFAIVTIAAIASIGCASTYTAISNHEEVYATDSLNEHTMTVDDVIALSRAGVGDNVIIHQMKATHSTFRLSNNDILDLKKAGVSDDVINAMIARPQYQGFTRGYYYYPWYYDPNYFSFSYWYYRPFYIHQHYYYPRFLYQNPPAIRHYGGTRR